jgi:photosystem II stability/assembly factor-like uncharacterized protein
MKKATVSALLFFIVFYSQTIHAQWITHGPYGCNPRSLGSINNILISANSYSGVFFSSNNGINWFPVSLGITPYTSANTITIKNTQIFVGTNYHGVYKSTDSGLNWSQMNTGFPAGASVNEMASDNSRIFAAGGNVYLSTDDGNSWVNRSNGLSSNVTREAFLFDGNYVYCATDGFYYTTNDGLNWISSNNGLPSSPYIRCLAKDSSNHIVAGLSSGVYLSANNGQNWQYINLNQTARSLIFKQNVLYAGTDIGIYKTTNLGLNWTLINNGLLSTNFQFESMLVKDNIIFAGNYGSLNPGGGYSGIYYSTNNGNNWIYSVDGISGLIANSLCAVNNTIFCGTSSDLFRSTDAGNNWSLSGNGITQKYIECVSGNVNYVFAGTDGSGIFLSTDMGSTWLSKNSGLNNSTVDAIEIAGTNTYVNAYGGINAGIYFSSNYGTNWFRRSGTLANINDFASANNYVFASTLNQGVYVTTNSGNDWSAVNNNLTNLLTRCLNYYDNKLLAGTTLGGAFYSTDYGANWVNMNLNNVTNSTVTDIISVNGIIITGTATEGIFYTTNTGVNWFNVNQGLDNFVINSLCHDNQYLYAGSSGRSVWKKPVSQLVSISNIHKNVPDIYSLCQNYPNPFNPVTTIQYELPRPGVVRLAVYDVTGREVSVLVNENQSAGTYESTFNGSSMTSGVYFYRIRSSDFVSVKRMVLIK